MDLSGLNEEQQRAVLYGDDPLLVLAGAGTGKTTVITHRIAHLMKERGVGASEVLAVTFTNKAAREMRERAATLSGHAPRSLDIGTFHGICGRVLRAHGPAIGLQRNFVIYDQDDQLALMRRCANDLNIDAQQLSPRNIRSRIDGWKNQGWKPDAVEIAPYDAPGRRTLDVYRSYEKRCLEANAVDFGDMLLHVVTLLAKHRDILNTLRARWTHLLVDEYQDTNPVQYQLLKALATPAHSLTVVGDDDQSIYRWRGADIGNILRFEKDFPGAEVIRLERNYRSTSTILDAANAVIAHNASRKGKTLFTDGEEGVPLRLRLFGSERDEAEAVAADVQGALDEDVDPAEIALLYRINAQSRPLEDALRRARIPYAIFGGMRFYDRREVKDGLAYLRLLSNPRSEMDFLRIVNAPARGIGKTTLERLTQWIGSHEGCSMLDAARAFAEGGGKTTPRVRDKLRMFVEMVDHLVDEVSNLDCGELLGRVLEASGYLEALRMEGTEEAEERISNLNELLAAVDEYSELADDPSLEGFLEEVSLATDLDRMGAEAGQVSLMTLHSAKGLEFEVVFLPGLEEGLFPHSRSTGEPAALEEERRLCYVGITRAKRRLCMSAARMRVVFGETRSCELSRFVAEVPAELLQFGDEVEAGGGAQIPSSSGYEAPGPGAGADEYVRHEASATDSMTPGSKISHRTFGQGKVVSSSGIGKQRKLTIDFPEAGRKVIVARFVELA